MSKNIENDLKDAFDELCPEVFENVLSKCESPKERVPARIPKRKPAWRVALIAAAIALLLVGALTATIFALNKAPEPQPTPDLPVETIEKVETPTPTEIATETPVETPTVIEMPTEVATPTQTKIKKIIPASKLVSSEAGLSKGNWISSYIDGYGILKILEITHDTGHKNSQDRETLYTRVVVETIYAKGMILRDYKLLKYSDLLSDHDFWMPTALVEELTEGEIILCELYAYGIGNKLEIVGGPNHDNQSLTNFSCFPFIDDKLIVNENRPLTINYYNTALNNFQKNMEKGFTYEYEELFERMPTFRYRTGATIDEMISIFEWFNDLWQALDDDGFIIPFETPVEIPK